MLHFLHFGAQAFFPVHFPNLKVWGFQRLEGLPNGNCIVYVVLQFMYTIHVDNHVYMYYVKSYSCISPVYIFLTLRMESLKWLIADHCLGRIGNED